VNETSARRGRRYVTNVIDTESADLLMMAKDRGSEALGEFAAAMAEHGAKPEQITEIVMDMSPAYVAGAMEHLPRARVVFDAFHMMSRPPGERQIKAARRVRRRRVNLAKPWTRCARIWPGKAPIGAEGSGPCEAMRGRATASSSNAARNSWRLIRPWDA